MQLGALVPFGEFGGAPESVRDYAQGLEAAGYDFVEAPDHDQPRHDLPTFLPM